MSKKYAVAAAACYVTIPGAGSVLLYRDAPVPDGVEDLERLAAEGLVVEVAEDNLGGLQSDIPIDLESPAEPLSPVVRYGVDADKADKADKAERADERDAKADAEADAKAKAAAEKQHAARRTPEKGGA